MRVKIDKKDVIAKIDCKDAKLLNMSFIIINAISNFVEKYRKRRFNSSSTTIVIKLRNLVFAKLYIII